MSEINLSSNIKGAIDDMLQGSIAGNISLIGGSAAVIEPKNITENGTYEAPEGVDGYNPITVNVPSEEPTIDNIYINYNGTFEASTYGWDGFGKVEVEVIPNVIPITINENGTYIPETADGYNPVVVNVDQHNQKLSNAFNQYTESSMNIYYNINGIETRWNGGSNIACQLFCPFDLIDFNKVKINLNTGTSYYNTIGSHPVREIWIGIVEYPPSIPYDATSLNYLEYFRYHEDNSTYSYEFDLSNIVAAHKYITFNLIGWNIFNLSVELI